MDYNGKIGLSPLARVMGVDRQQQKGGVWKGAGCMCGDWDGIVFGDCVCVGVVYVVVELMYMGYYAGVCILVMCVCVFGYGM